MRNLNFLIKPASSLCNLRCQYCFYADEAANRSQASMGLMSSETVEILLSEAFRTVEHPGHISFVFQAGEPTYFAEPGLGCFFPSGRFLGGDLDRWVQRTAQLTSYRQ